MVVKGFKTAAVSAGIKAGGKLDLALICSDVPATAAAVFTQNTFIAAPLIVSKVHLKESGHRIRAVLVNSGNANAATGEVGIQAAQLSAAALAEQLGCRRNEIVVSSTGVIGRPFPLDKLRGAIPALVSALLPTNIELLARGIIDHGYGSEDRHGRGRRRKNRRRGQRGRHDPSGHGHHALVHHDRRRNTACGTRRGSALCRASLIQFDLRRRRHLHQRYGGGDGQRRVCCTELQGSGQFRDALLDVCTDLATAIVRDGEGATKFIEILIEGAPGEEEAHTIGRTIARSPLFKTAVYGADPIGDGLSAPSATRAFASRRIEWTSTSASGDFRFNVGGCAPEIEGEGNSNPSCAALRPGFRKSVDLRSYRGLYPH